MSPPAAASRPTALTVSWGLPLALAIVALAIPVSSTARWLGGAHGVTDAQLQAGVWLFKASLIVLAIAAALVSRLASSEGTPAVGPELAAGAGTTDHASPNDNARDAALRPLDRRVVVALGAILALATVLRLVHLNTELWLDEIAMLARYITLRIPQILSTYDSQNEHTLYSLLSHAMLGIGGGDWVIRLPAVAFGVASLWATFAFARRVTSTAESLLAPLVLALSYHHVWFSQNARGYTAILFFTLITSALYLRLMEGTSRPARMAWLYAALMALAVYTHLTAALVAVGHAIALLIDAAFRRRSAEWSLRALRWPLVATVLSGLLTASLYAVVVPQLFGEVLTPTMASVEIEWTSPQWLIRETLRVLASAAPGGIAAVVVVLLVFGVGIHSYWKLSRRVTLIMFAPVMVTAAAVLALRHNLWPRFFFFGAAFFVLAALRGGFVVARWVFRSWGDRVAIAGAMALACLSGLTVPRAWNPKQQFDAAARYVDSQRAPGDSVVALDIAALVYSLYHTPRDWQLALDEPTFRRTEQRASRMWVVYTFGTRVRALFPALARQLDAPPYRDVRVFPSTVGGGEIHVLLRDSPTTP